MKLKKFLAITMSAALAMTALTACGSKTDDSKSSDKKTAKVIEIDLTDEEYAFGVDKTQPIFCQARSPMVCACMPSFAETNNTAPSNTDKVQISV